MNLFLKRILLLTLPILLALLFTEYLVRTIPNSYQLKGDYLEKNAGEIESLVLGSSHTFYGIQPKYFNSNTFNVSNVSQSPDMDLAILESYEDQFLSLSIVIIRLSYDTLFEQLKNSDEDWRLKDYKLYTDVKFDYTYKHNSELLSKGTRASFIVLKNYYFNDESLLNCDNLGWGNDLENRPQTNLNKAGLFAAKKHTIKNWTLLDDNILNFERLVEWCQIRNIKVLLVTPPAFKSYSEHLDKKQLSKMIEVGNNLNLKFDNCNYYNLMDSQDFIAEDFYDADHLNKTGAKKFSLMINSLIEN